MTSPIGSLNPAAMTNSAKVLFSVMSEAVRFIGSLFRGREPSAAEQQRHMPDKFSQPKREDAAKETRSTSKESFISKLGTGAHHLASRLFSRSTEGSDVSTRFSEDSSLSRTKFETAVEVAPASSKDFAALEKTALPKGFVVDANGMVASTMPIYLHPSALRRVGLSERDAPATVIDMMAAKAATICENASQEVKLPDGKTMMLSSQVAGDLGRMHVLIPTAQGEYDSNAGKGTPQEKLPTTARNLLDFTGSEKSAQVLSSFTNQFTIRDFPRAMESTTGGVLMPRWMSTHEAFELTRPDGQVENFTGSKQMGDAEFKLSKTENGDFRIDLNWVSYVKSFGTIEEVDTPKQAGGPTKTEILVSSPLTLAANNALRQEVSLSLTLSAESAANGEIKIVASEDPQISYQGKVDVKKTAEAVAAANRKA